VKNAEKPAVFSAKKRENRVLLLTVKVKYSGGHPNKGLYTSLIKQHIVDVK
jgi:hypothetical protein